MSTYLSEDLIDEIFQRLPPKSLLQLRSLSKSWCSRISSPDFIRRHTLRSIKIPSKVLLRHWFDSKQNIYTLHSEDQLPVYPKRGYTDVTAVDFPFPGNNFRIVGSCNGILCLFCEKNADFGITLWNFSTRRKLTLNRSLKDFGFRVVVGFGFDPTADDYKILKICYPMCEEAAQTSFVYTLKTGFWSAIDPPNAPFSDVQTEGCFINGKLHWVIKCYSTEIKSTRCDFIMTFDMSSHVFGKIVLPEPTGKFRQLSIIDGCLAVVCSDSDDSWIWVMKEYNNNNVEPWSMVLKFKIPGMFVSRVLQPTTNGDLLINVYFWSGCYSLYNHKSGVLSKLLDFRASETVMEMKTYVETLELLKGGTPCGETIFP